MIRRMTRCAGFEDGFAVLGVLCVAGMRGCSRKCEHRDKPANLSCAFHWERPYLKSDQSWRGRAMF
jgi:hypothetical protein